MDPLVSLAARLRHPRLQVFEEALRDAIMEGPEGEAELVSALDVVAEVRRIRVVGVLGDAQGEAGPAAIRKVLSMPAKRDLRCVALLALAKRCGEDASPDLLAALNQRDAVGKRYAMIALAGAGDDRAWDVALVRLRQLLHRPGPPPRYNPRFLPLQSAVAVCVSYLAQHLDGPGGPRTVQLVRTVRRDWDRVGSGEREWLAEVWAQCAPGGPPESAVPPPSGERLQRAIRDLMFKPVF